MDLDPRPLPYQGDGLITLETVLRESQEDSFFNIKFEKKL